MEFAAGFITALAVIIITLKALDYYQDRKDRRAMATFRDNTGRPTDYEVK